jgi:hypothetical protein
MKNKWMRFTLLLVSLILVSGLLFACTSKPSIVGYWQDTKQKNQYVEFTSDAKIIIDNGEMVLTGTYELIGENYVKSDDLNLGVFFELGSYTLKYQISGDTLKLQAGNESKTLKRVR